MELVLVRTYHADGTNGKLYANDRFQCFTIELPWENNLPQHSCIPEGRYELKKRYSQKFGRHLLVVDPGVVSDRPRANGRDLILIHPANDALKELRGCIAPVSVLSGPGRGFLSRRAFERVVELVYGVLEHGASASTQGQRIEDPMQTVYLTIKKEER